MRERVSIWRPPAERAFALMLCRHANRSIVFETLCRCVTIVGSGIVAMGLVDGETPGKVRVGLFLVREDDIDKIAKGVEGAALDACDESGEKHGGIGEELLLGNGFHRLEVRCIGVGLRMGAAAAAVMVRATLLFSVGMGMGIKMTGLRIMRGAHFHI